MLRSFWKFSCIGLLTALCGVVNAATITCGNEYRVASLGSADSCFTGSGNTKLDDVEGYLGGEWDPLGGVSSSTTNGYLTVNLLTGSWGSGGPITGTWAIDQSFWSVYGAASLSIHVGNGRYDPDHFVWLITDGQTSGTWTYAKLSGNGGGLSNMHLWGSGEPNIELAEPNLLLLIMFGLLSVFVARRRV